MNTKIKNILGVSLSTGALVLAFSSLILANAFLKSKEPARTFTVSAEGEVVAIPDIAEFTFSVITEGGENLPVLQEENSSKSNQVNAYLKQQGIEADDIKTTSYNISPRYQTFPCAREAIVCPPSEIVGYTIAHSVKVKVRNLSRVGELLSGVITAGANSSSGLTFSIDDIEKVQSQARDIALQKAKEKAKNIASSAGVRLGKIVSIQESFQVPFLTREFAQKLTEPAAAPVIEPGAQEVKVSITLLYEIR